MLLFFCMLIFEHKFRISPVLSVFNSSRENVVIFIFFAWFLVCGKQESKELRPHRRKIIFFCLYELLMGTTSICLQFCTKIYFRHLMSWKMMSFCVTMLTEKSKSCINQEWDEFLPCSPKLNFSWNLTLAITCKGDDEKKLRNSFFRNRHTPEISKDLTRQRSFSRSLFFFVEYLVHFRPFRQFGTQTFLFHKK